MATIGNISIGLTVNTVNFQKSLFKASGMLKQFGKSGAADVAAGAARIQSALSRLVTATQLKELKAGLSSAAGGAAQLVKGLGKLSLSGLGSGLATAAKNLKTLGAGLGGLGATAALTGVAVGFGAAVKQSTSLEDAFVGLSKAADLEGESLAAMRSQLYGLATGMKGVKLEDVLSIATSGAKQGVAADQLVEYTRGVAMLATAMDDLPAEEIADSVGKINVVFKLGVGGAMQLGSAIDKLADSGVSSASGIMDVTQRISGTAAAMHLGADQTVALAAALLDTGTLAERGASALDKMLNALVKVDNHEGFAKAIGVDVAEFSKLVETKPVEAVQAFLGALRNLDANGQIETLNSVGIVADGAEAEIKKLAQQTDVLAKYLGLSANEFKTLEQITNSYNKSAQTTNSQFTQLGNNLKIALGHAGDVLTAGIEPWVKQLNWLLDSFNKVVDYFGGGAKIQVAPEVQAKGDAKAKALTEAARQELAGPAADVVAESAADKTKDLGKGVKELEADLKRQVATFGKSSAEADLYKLAVDGATAAQLKSARTLASQVSALEKHKQLMERGKEVTEENLNPFEQYIARLKELDGLLKSQAITLQTYERAKKQAFEATDVGAMTKELKTSIATMHMTSEEAKLYELQLGGASKEQLASAGSLLALNRGMEQAKSVFEETRTPLEQYFKKLNELDALKQAGLITPDTYARGLKQAGGDLGVDERSFAGAQEFGSAEAYSSILAYQGADSGDSIRDVAKRSKEQVDLLGKILVKLGADRAPGEQLKVDGVSVIPF